MTARADKLNVEVFQSQIDKVSTINKLAFERGFSLDKTIYIGNDLNDYHAMQLCGYALCPNDSHTKIKDISTIILKANGGEGIVRELVEDILSLDLLAILFEEKN